MERRMLIDLYKDLEDNYVYGKKSTNAFIHIMSYFLAVCLATILTIAFAEIFISFNPFFILIANLVVVLFGIFLIIRGIIIASQSRRYYATLLKNMEAIQNAIQKQEHNKK